MGAEPCRAPAWLGRRRRRHRAQIPLGITFGLRKNCSPLCCGSLADYEFMRAMHLWLGVVTERCDGTREWDVVCDGEIRQKPNNMSQLYIPKPKRDWAKIAFITPINNSAYSAECSTS